MADLEIAVRLIVIGQLVLVAVVFVNSRGTRPARFWGLALMLCVIGYLVTSSPALSAGLHRFSPLFTLLAILVPYSLWLFAHAIFEAPRPPIAVLVIIGLVVPAVWFIHLFQDTVPPVWTDGSLLVQRSLALLIVLHAVWLTLSGRRDDLIEPRRRLRLFFVGIVSLQVAAVLVVELVLGGQLAPLPLQFFNVLVIAVMTLGLSVPMLRLSEDFFPLPVSRRQKAPAAALSETDRVLCDEILAMMDHGCYRETGLTIPKLAGKIGYPEYQLRRLINGQLGFRNFSAFLNSYRIAAAKRELANPDRARIPVLTIALELGYASLGPFNRAFKAMTGQTPTEYRRDNIGAMQVD